MMGKEWGRGFGGVSILIPPAEWNVILQPHISHGPTECVCVCVCVCVHVWACVCMYVQYVCACVFMCHCQCHLCLLCKALTTTHLDVMDSNVFNVYCVNTQGDCVYACVCMCVYVGMGVGRCV